MRRVVSKPVLIRLLALLLLAVLLSPAVQVSCADEIPSPIRAVLAQVGSMLEQKEYRKAAEIIAAFQAKEGNSGHPELSFALGNCYLLQNRPTEAVQAYTLTVTRDPKHSRCWLNLAKAHYEIKQYREAGRCFQKGYETETVKHPDNLYYSAAAYLMAGAHQESVAAFDQLLAAHPGACKTEWKEPHIQALLGAGQGKRALPLIRELAKVSSPEQGAQWQEMLLYQYVALNLHTEALAYCRELIEQQPQAAKWWKALVHIQLSGNHLEEALTALTIYGHLTPLSAKETQLLADLYLQAGIPQKAAPLYAERLKAEPDGQLLQRLALSYHQMGEPRTALEALAQFKGLAADPRLLMLKGELHYSLNQYAEAAASYRQAALCNNAASGQAWLMAGYAALQLQDLTAGQEAFAQAAKHDKEKKAATLALNQLRQVTVQ